jgi:hypothetical protein
MYGHVEKLARQVKAGVDSVAGVEGVLYQVRFMCVRDYVCVIMCA